jgi:hypothetical protein
LPTRKKVREDLRTEDLRNSFLREDFYLPSREGIEWCKSRKKLREDPKKKQVFKTVFYGCILTNPSGLFLEWQTRKKIKRISADSGSSKWFLQGTSARTSGLAAVQVT